MRQQFRFSAILITVISLIVLGLSAQVASSAPKKKKSRTSIGFIGGVGEPVGWWGDRWDMPIVSEINYRQEFSPGAGLLLFAGLNKTHVAKLSDDEIISESRLGEVKPEFKPYTNITYISQSGSYKENPIGIGFYFERMVTQRRLRGYGTAALVVHIWKLTRSQSLTRVTTRPGFPEILAEDNWSANDDGSDLGAQVALGLSYQMRQFMFFDASVAYNFSNVGKHNGAVLYWGQPGRTRTGGVYDESEGSTDLLEVRFGFRFGS